MKTLQVVFFTAAPTVVLALVLVSMRRQILDNRRAILFLAVACALFFHRILFLPETISQSDANLLQVQFFDVYREAVRTHCEIPFWNPYQATGLPNLAHPLSAMFYPLVPLFLVGSVFKALGIFTLPGQEDVQNEAGGARICAALRLQRLGRNARGAPAGDRVPLRLRVAAAGGAGL